MNIFIYYPYHSNIILKNILKNFTFLVTKNGLYPPETARNAPDNPKCSNVLHRFFNQTRILHPLTEI